ncbi:MAG: Gfo/Idh/MocA family oxidoreductase [Acidimicrobiia bacterium]|nr:Gfo/Idh/MocA family oxidoreductase [Acidimicrobiia bacterium]
MATTRALVVGCGSIGRRHLRNLHALGYGTLWATDPDPAARALAAEESGATPMGSLEEALATGPSLVLVCTPPHLHVPFARRAIAAGADVFIEKPIDVAVTPDLDALLGEADAAGRIVACGYNLRCHAGLRAVKAAVDAGQVGRVYTIDIEFGFYLPDWRPGVDYRANYGARREQGGGILLDASHEVDYLRWLGGDVASVHAVLQKSSDLEMDVEDTAWLTCRMVSGVLAQVRLDCLQRRYSRRCKVVGSEATVEWSWQDGVVRWVPGAEAQPLAAVPDPNLMYLDELRDLMEAVTTRRAPVSTGRDARASLAVIDAARLSSADRREVHL